PCTSQQEQTQNRINSYSFHNKKKRHYRRFFIGNFLYSVVVVQPPGAYFASTVVEHVQEPAALRFHDSVFSFSTAAAESPNVATMEPVSSAVAGKVITKPL